MKFLGIILLTASSVAALSGKATTTRYYDGLEGACGCGSNNAMSSWQSGGNGFYTAAGSTSLFGSGTWCGSGCGTCYKLTSTGSAPSGQGTGGASGQSIIVMVTNLCPYNGNERWCPQSGNNQYGYGYHFDIMAQNEVLGDNAIVDFEETACPSAASSDFSQCQCA
ncbi:Endoglucanase-5 [Gnomoniopsis smithogilvyi]|uniref:Cellulase n=1 Tax=Gnomoniopsis smithogilvyi TaxID=1191159 RepID=A0A9W9CSU3_9PEZI|nr:Endoglucanase-5 [Gnomoniopsis smithogilvyi]